MPKLTNYRLAVLSILLTMLCYSCGEADKHKDIDVEIEGKYLNPLRFDQDFFNVDWSNPQQVSDLKSIRSDLEIEMGTRESKLTSNSQLIDISKLSNGIYLVKIETHAETTFNKLIVNH